MEATEDTGPQELETTLHSSAGGGIQETHLFVFGTVKDFLNKIHGTSIPGLFMKECVINPD